MRILCTFPGRYGDLLWALPSIRALSRRLGQPIDLCIAGEFASIVPLLRQQPYLGQVYAYAAWSLASPESWRTPLAAILAGPGPYTEVCELGYRGWPERGLPYETLFNLNAWHTPQLTALFGADWMVREAALDLQTPWITVEGPGAPTEVAVGFTEAWFELKFGLMCLLDRHLPPYLVTTPPGTRWRTEGVGLVGVLETDWLGTARALRNADLFLGDCSALHVLATAIGTPAVVMEPMEARWNPIFWPLGMDGPQIAVVRGGDGRPTFDARATLDKVQSVLAALRA